MGSRFHLTDEETGLEMLSKLAYQVGQLGLKIDNSVLVNFRISSIYALALCSTAMIAHHNFQSLEINVHYL